MRHGPHRTTRRWTAHRQAWLERLEQGPAARAANPVGFQCMELGWTDWERGAGERPTHRETLTEAGRAQLAAWRAEGRTV